MTYLYDATKTWTNVPPLNYEYKDSEWRESLGIDNAEGYESFTSIDGIGKINGVIFTKTELLRARMPIYTSIYDRGVKIEEYGEVADYNEKNGYLYENIDNGYWTLSSVDSSASSGVACVAGNYISICWIDYGDDSDRTGVRPVINLKL